MNFFKFSLVFLLALCKQNVFSFVVPNGEETKSVEKPLFFGGEKIIDDFPEEFHIDNTHFGLEAPLKFVPLKKNSDAKVFTLDPVSKQPVEFEFTEDHEFKTYVNAETQSVSTLHRANKNEPFKMIAAINDVKNGHVYEVNPSQKTEDSTVHPHIVSRRSVDPAQYVKDMFAVKLPKIVERKKRQTIAESGPYKFTIELLFVADCSMYQHHRTHLQTNDQQFIFNHMKILLSHLVAAADQLYVNNFAPAAPFTINLRVNNFLFLTNNADCEWSNVASVGVPGIPTLDGKEVINADKALPAFATFASSLTFKFDHAIGFVNKEMYALGSWANGVAYMGGMCQSKINVQLSKLNGFTTPKTLAHEIAHNLGSDHDGTVTATSCPSDNYIMSTGGNGPNNLLNIYKFTPCTREQIKNTLLDSMGKLWTKYACVKDISGTASKDTLGFVDKADGELWSPDQQCKLTFGPQASFCVGLANQMCGLLYCKKTPEDTSCWHSGMGAAEGTVCGSGKSCSKGQCVTNSKVPASTCVFGDDTINDGQLGYTGIANLPKMMTCPQTISTLIANNRSPTDFCNYYRDQCCFTCDLINKVNCADKYSNCPSFVSYCKGYSFSNGEQVDQACPLTCGLCKAVVTCQTSTDVCLNGGLCSNKAVTGNEIIGYKCTCPAGFKGDRCEQRDHCAPNPCLNGGVCLPSASFYVCSCPNGFAGFRCETVA